MKDAWNKSETEYLALPTPDNYRKLEEKAKAYELGYMLFGREWDEEEVGNDDENCWVEYPED